MILGITVCVENRERKYWLRCISFAFNRSSSSVKNNEHEVWELYVIILNCHRGLSFSVSKDLPLLYIPVYSLPSDLDSLPVPDIWEELQSHQNGIIIL